MNNPTLKFMALARNSLRKNRDIKDYYFAFLTKRFPILYSIKSIDIALRTSIIVKSGLF